MNALLKGGGVNKGRIVQEAFVFWTKWGECVSRWENQITKQIKDVWHPFPWM
jgi:hypothetical protein